MLDKPAKENTKPDCGVLLAAVGGTLNGGLGNEELNAGNLDQHRQGLKPVKVQVSEQARLQQSGG